MGFGGGACDILASLCPAICSVPIALLTLLSMRIVLLGIAAIPFIYYAIALYSTLRFFLKARLEPSEFAPPVSNLKPVRGLDLEAYENFASFCWQDYPNYEILFGARVASDEGIKAARRVASGGE